MLQTWRQIFRPSHRFSAPEELTFHAFLSEVVPQHGALGAAPTSAITHTHRPSPLQVVIADAPHDCVTDQDAADLLCPARPARRARGGPEPLRPRVPPADVLLAQPLVFLRGAQRVRMRLREPLWRAQTARTLSQPRLSHGSPPTHAHRRAAAPTRWLPSRRRHHHQHPPSRQPPPSRWLRSPPAPPTPAPSAPMAVSEATIAQDRWASEAEGLAFRRQRPPRPPGGRSTRRLRRSRNARSRMSTVDRSTTARQTTAGIATNAPPAMAHVSPAAR